MIGVHVESFFCIGAALVALMLVPTDVELDTATLCKPSLKTDSHGSAICCISRPSGLLARSTRRRDLRCT